MPEVTPEFIQTGLIWFVVFLFSTTCHEAAHAFVAKLGGDPTASDQVTLNPFPHMRQEPLGMVVVPILAYSFAGWILGWAKTYYNTNWADRYPRRAAWMALAGPLTNFLLMLAAAVAIRIGMAAAWFRSTAPLRTLEVVVGADPESVVALLATVLSVTFALNFILGTLNLFPIPPFDGNRAITLLMPEDAARRFLDFFRIPHVGTVAILIVFFGYGEVFHMLFWPLRDLLF